MVYFESKEEVNDDGKVEFMSAVLHTVAARARYHGIFNFADRHASAEESN